MKFTNTTSISDAMRSKMSLDPIRNFWDAMLDKNYYEIYLHLKYLFATNWLARLTSRYLYLFGDFGAHDEPASSCKSRTASRAAKICPQQP